MELRQAISTATNISGLSCPDCNSQSFRKHGTHLGIQRYRCKHCGRTFKESINTALHWIHKKQQMLEYAGLMHEQHTIRNAAGLLEISKNTSFCWRHKLLSSLRIINAQPAKTPSGVIQINLPHSDKGKRNIPESPKPASRTFLISDAQGHASLQMLPAGATSLDGSRILRSALLPEASIACAPANLLTRSSRLAERPRVIHREAKRKLIARAKYASSQLGNWMEFFRGVATKYLQQYWNWYCAQISLTSVGDFSAECFGQRQLQNYRKIVSL